MMQKPYLLGIDAGGTKSQVMVWRQSDGLAERPADELEELAVFSGRFAGINLDLLSLDEATRRLRSMLEAAADAIPMPPSAFGRQVQVVVGMAGLDTPEDFARAEQWLQRALAAGEITSDWTLLSDVELGLWAASPSGTGILLIAGTGSNCFGRNSAGQTAKAGGMSHFFSDEGSGFFLGFEALHLITKMHDGRLEKTELYDAVLAEYGLTSLAELKRHIVQAPDYKHLVARAAPALQASAAQGEPNARAVVARAVNDLADMVRVVHQRLGGEDLPVFCVGSILRDEAYFAAIQENLRPIAIHQTIIEMPVLGAVRL